MKVRLAGAVVCVGLFAVGCACWGQAPVERKTPPDQDVPVQTLKLESRLVTLSVNAVDANGSPAGGLEQKDFRLLEDGKEQKIAFFDKQSSTPLSVVLALDGSESVQRNEKLEKQAAEKFVKSVVRTDAGGQGSAAAGDEVDLMEFDETVTEVVSFTSDRKRLSDGFDHMERGDATALYDCVYLASQRLGQTKQGGGRRRVLVLITDGGDTVHGVQYPQAVEQAQRAGVMIYSLIVIPIYADAGRNTGGEHALIQMADDTGGKYFYVEDAKDLGPALQKVSDDLRTQYVLGYYAPEKAAKDRNSGYRALKVELTNQDLAGKIGLRYRSGYY